MSKKIKAKTKQKNLIAKRARKAANRAKYDELKRTGQNRKSRRSIFQSKKTKKVRTVSHPDGPCGNIGCVRCDPEGIHKLRKTK